MAVLREQLASQEQAKKLNEAVKTLIALGDELVDAEERIEAYLRAADLYANKFQNQAEAVRAYEKVVEVDPLNPLAIDYLRQMYEKRRDWEKLIGLNVAQARTLEAGPDRSAAFKDIARLATERVKKPEVCVALWAEVVESDAVDLEALNALSQLYERARDYEKLAGVLERLAELTYDTQEKIQILNKLGQIAGDRLNDDVRAVEAYRSLLILVPDDRRAQEQLKKRYVALGRWDDLEVFYADSGKWDEFIRVLETNETKTQDVGQRIAMLMKIAELWMTQKGKSDRAARAYEKVLQLDETNLAAAERLVPIYSEGNNAKGLASVIEVKLVHIDEPNARLALLREVAALYDGRVGDKVRAFERFVEAFSLFPLETECQTDLNRIAKSTGRWAEVVTAYRTAISSVDVADASSLRLQLGRVLVEELQELEAALTEYRAVHDAEPENAEALDALERLYQRAERWRDLLDVYARKLELLDASDDRKLVRYEVARLYEERLADISAAVETYQTILSENPGDGRALEALDRLYQQSKAWASYAEVLSQRIELDVDEPTLIDLKFRLAEVQLSKLEAEADALTNFREILFIEPEHEGARLALEGLLASGTLREEAAATLEGIYENRSDWEKLIGALEILASGASDAARGVELLRKVAGVAGTQLGHLERAVEAQARALRLDPTQSETREELESYAEQAGALDRLSAIYAEVAGGLKLPELAREYWMRLAAIEERQARVEQAAAAYEKVLGIDAADAGALQAMDSLYRRTEHWTELVQVFRRRIELADDVDLRESLFGQMAAVYEERLGKPEEAIAAYREVLSLDPSSSGALAALDGLFSRQRLWQELSENLETQLALVDSDEAQLEIMLRLAALREVEMGQPEAAIEGYRQVTERDPSNTAALGALERLGAAPEFELQIAEILEPFYREQGDFRKLIGVHEVQVRRADDLARKVELLQQIAALYEDAAGDINSAFDTLARALTVDPSSEDASLGLDRLARVLGRFNDLANVFESLGSAQPEPDLAAQLITAAARVYENDVQNVDKAIELYRKVLSIDPTNLSAAESLQSLFQMTERFSDMSLILQRKAEMLDVLDDQKGALYEAARIEEDILDRKESAIGVYQKVLEIDSEDLKSVDALIGLYLGLSRWEELLGVYSRKADLVVDPDEKKLIFYQVGAVYERELGDVRRAIDTYQRVLELDPDDVEALGRLDVLYQAAENWQELLSVLMHEAELTVDAIEAVAFQYRIAELFEKRLEDIERAVELYRDILSTQPDHVPTLESLEGIKNGTLAPLAAAGVLEPVYDAAGEWARLISVLEVQVAHGADAFVQVELLHRIAALYEESLGDHRNAFTSYARAVRTDISNEDSLSSVERLATVTDNWAEVAALYDSELARLGENAEQAVELGLRVAQVYEVQLEKIEGAVERYRAVMVLDEQNQSAVRSLDRLFSQLERWADLATILSRESEIGDTPEEILEFRFRLGQVRQHRLVDLDGAIEAYREVIAAAPEHEATLVALEDLFAQGLKLTEVCEILEPLYQANSDWEKLLKIHEAQLVLTTGAEERLAMYYRIAEDAEEKLGDAVLAFQVVVRALKEHPLDERCGEEIERLAANNLDSGWEQLANAYADVLGIEGSTPEVQSAIGKRLARVFEEELADVQKAEETYRYVLTVVEREVEALANLDRIYTGLEQWPELAGVLEQRAVSESDERERVEFYTRLGQVYDERLNQTPDAVRAYRRVFDELEPTNEDAIGALGRIYAATEQWELLRGVYQRELENAVGDVQEAEIRAKLASLASERLGNLSDAVEGWKRVLDLRGEDSEALWALADLYQHQSQWAELTDVLERHFDIADSDEERVSILTRRARLFSEQLNRDDEALETWQRALDIDFANVPALRAVTAIWRKRADASELVTALHSMIDRAAGLLDSDELVATYRELGKTYGVVLEQPFEAADAWRHLLEVDGRDFEALAELERIYRADERWTDVIDIKMRRAAAFPIEEEKIRELLEVTDLWRDQVGEYDQAVEAYDRILEVDAAHFGAFEALERLHTAAERWEPLIELYLNRLETRESAEEKGDLLRRIARVFEEKLDDSNQAFDALVNAFAEDFGDDETARYLERMSQSTSRWPELLATANSWLQEQTESRKRIQLCLRLGKWYGQDLQRPDWSQGYYEQVRQLDPSNVQVLRLMAANHRITANWQRVGETLQAALNVAVASDDRKAILVDMGELLERNMGQVDAGIVYYRRALEVDALFLPALDALERIYEAQSDASQVVEILSAKVQALGDSEQVPKHKLRMGQLYETSLRDLEKAGRMYREVLATDGGNLVALRGLERIDDLTQNWTDLVQVLERQLDVLETERERVEVLLKLAGVLEDQFLKAETAAQRLEAVLEIDPTEERAYVALARCYRRLKQWLDLVNTYERHIAEIANQATKVELYGQIAQVFSEEVGDVDRAIDAYQNIVDIDDTNIVALDALSKLHEKQGDTSRAIDAMTRVADLTVDGKQRVEMYYRIGRSLEEKLGDRAQAQERLEMALDLDPSHLLTLAALRTIAVDEADWARAERYLDQEQANTQAPRARAKLLVELGKLRDDQLSEHESAVEAYELAMQSDEDCEDAALPLVEEYVRTERWVQAEPLAEMLVRKAKNKDRSEQQMLQKLLGKVLAALGHADKALKAYQASHQLDLTDQEAIRGIADCGFVLQDWPTALSNYQKVLTALGEDELEARTDTYFRLGCIKREQAQARQAINNFEKALALNGEHRPTLDALVDIYAKSNDWKQVAAYKRQILDSIYEGDERLALLSEIGDVWADREKNWSKAIEALEEALDLRPNDHVLLHKLLKLYQSAGDWQKMVDVLQRIGDLESRPEVKSRYLFTQGQLYRDVDKLNDSDRALELFNESLDLNPSYLEAFARIEKIRTQTKDWKRLERDYRKMLHRIAGKGDTKLEYQLWHALGLIYRDRMQQVGESIEAFKMASAMRPENVTEREILVELYENSERWDDAIAEQRRVVAAEPSKAESYRTLYRLFLHKRSYDEAWCVASVLSFLGEADADEARFYSEWKPEEGILKFRGGLTSELWSRHLTHPDAGGHLSRIFELLTPAALKAKNAELRMSGKLPVTEARFKQDPQTSTVTFARTFGFVAQVLGIACPELYVRSDLPVSIVAAQTDPPSSFAGQGVLAGYQPQDLAFICGKHLASYRTDGYIRNLFQTQSELTTMFFAGVVIAAPNTPLPPELANNVKLSAQALMRFMQPVEMEHLRVTVKRWMADGSTANIKRWGIGMELTAARAGLLVSGDLDIARRILGAEQALPGDMTPAEKMTELLVFAVSEDYSALRRGLGVAIEVEG